jgi:hypothetical protein
MNEVNRIRRGAEDALEGDDPNNFLMNQEIHLCIPCLLSHFEQSSLCPGPCQADISGWMAGNGEFTPIQLRRRNIEEAIHYDPQIEFQQLLQDFRARAAREEAQRVELQPPALEEVPEPESEDDQR